MSQSLLSVPAFPLGIVSCPAGSLWRKEGDSRIELGLVQNHLRPLATTRKHMGACATVPPQSLQPLTSQALPTPGTRLTHPMTEGEWNWACLLFQQRKHPPSHLVTPQNPTINSTWRPSSL